jgi:hypothetical protein
MTGTTWEHRLDSAHNEAAVLAVAREFLAQFNPVEISDLPERCRPPTKLYEAADISAYAYDLIRHECKEAGLGDLVHRLARFFSHASTRLAQVASRRYVKGNDNERETA